MCKINPRIDFAFKKLFGSEENKDLLISLINAIIDKPDKVIDIELKNPYNLAEFYKDKASILDIKAHDAAGTWFNIEMQIGEDRNFDKRSIYYWAKLITEQLGEGNIYNTLEKTININILDFNFIPFVEEFHNIYKITNINTGKDDGLHDIFELHYLELKKFTKTYQQISTPLDRWSTFFTHAHQLDKDKLPPALANDTAISKAVNAIDRMFDEEERTLYDARIRAFSDSESRVISALEKGMEMGLEQGLEQGLELGEQKKQLEIAKNLLDILDVETIALKTGLSITDIETLKTPQPTPKQIEK